MPRAPLVLIQPAGLPPPLRVVGDGFVPEVEEQAEGAVRLGAEGDLRSVCAGTLQAFFTSGRRRPQQGSGKQVYSQAVTPVSGHPQVSWPAHVLQLASQVT